MLGTPQELKLILSLGSQAPVFGTLSTPSGCHLEPSGWLEEHAAGLLATRPRLSPLALRTWAASAQHALRLGAHYASHNASRPRPTPAETPPGGSATPARRPQPGGQRRLGAMRRAERRVAGGSGSGSPLLEGRRSTESEVYDDGTNTFFW